ncbi:ferredoxin [Microbacterium karelineae]|uniref:ferredoxin n=1 Tax=Microbacterium karelineae TaxID=2654283 RepID=UPI0012EAC16B|nr:ferredoxin [Microbacterium karelineae]
MKVTINPTTCVASENCSLIAPRVFANREEDDGFVSVIDAHPPRSEWAAAREARDLCPSATIWIEEDADDTDPSEGAHG